MKLLLSLFLLTWAQENTDLADAERDYSGIWKVNYPICTIMY